MNSDKVKVLLEDIWTALDALDAVEGVQVQDWYQRLEQAADLATQELAIEKGLMARH